MKKSKLFLLMVLLVAWLSQAFAQGTNEVTWNLLREESGVKVYYAVGACDESQNRLWLKVENTTATNVVAHVDLDIVQSGMVSSVSQAHLDAGANSTVVFNCSNQSPHVINVPVLIFDAASFSCTLTGIQLSILID